MFIVSAVVLTVVGLLSFLGINANSEITAHSGDSISGLAQKYQVSPQLLAKDNHLSAHVTLQDNKQLVLPGKADIQAKSANTKDRANQNTEANVFSDHLSKTEQSAKDWIAYHESRGEYHVSNGQYYGKFELDRRLLHGDYSKANQEKTADRYVKHRYGSWVKAKHFWETHNWY